jgi:hypothetical protein
LQDWREMMSYKAFVCACLALCASQASAADFSFSFGTDTSDPNVSNGVSGTVSGRIMGLAELGSSRAQRVLIDSYTPTSGISAPVDATAWFSRFENWFTVSDGRIVGAAFHADNDFGPALDRLYINVPILGSSGTNYASLASNNRVSVWNNQGLGGITFSRLNSAVPEPATWAMMILGFGAVGRAMRKRPPRSLCVA